MWGFDNNYENFFFLEWKTCGGSPLEQFCDSSQTRKISKSVLCSFQQAKHRSYKACLDCSPENLEPKFKIDTEFCLGNISPIRQVFGVGVVWKTFSPSPCHPPSFNRRMSEKGYTLPAYDLFLRLLKC